MRSLALALCLLCAPPGGASAAPSGTALPAPARWLVAHPGGVSALLEDGSVVQQDAQGLRVLARGFSRDAPLRRCADALIGITLSGQLARIDADGQVHRSQESGLSVFGGGACRDDSAWALGADGSLAHFAWRDGGWTLRARAGVDALPDAQLALTPVEEGADALLVLARPDDARYRHGVLGDALEATALLLLDPETLAEKARLDLPAPAVFEDLAPRPLSLDGRTVIALVHAAPGEGAALVLVGASAGRLAIEARGPAFGRSNRWLNPIVGTRRLFAVHTPHIGGRLFSYSVQAGQLAARELASGLSNHRIGSRVLDAALLVREGADENELVIPDQAGMHLLRLSCVSDCRELAREALSAVLSSNLSRSGDALWAASADARLHRIALPP